MTTAPFHPSKQDEPWPQNFELSQVPDGLEDKPTEENVRILRDHRIANGEFPPLFLGCAPFSRIYSTEEVVQGSEPLRIVRLALRYGINVFDTAPSYHPSERILGQALHLLSDHFPRHTYKIITKCGKYGSNKEDHLLGKENDHVVRKGLERSMKRLWTDYLDVVYIHDVEFTASLVPPAGFHLEALTDPAKAKEYGLASEDAGKVWGEGDQKILDTIESLREMKKEGKIKRVGISCYPLPTLLRIAILILGRTGEPVDIVQTYSHQNLQNSALQAYLPHLRSRAKIPIITNASPLNMGLLTTSGLPDWHPAHKEKGLTEGMEEVKMLLRDKNAGKVEDLAVRYGMRDLQGNDGEKLPVVIGCGSLDQLHQAVASYVKVVKTDAATSLQEKNIEAEVRNVIDKAGYLDWSWQSP